MSQAEVLAAEATKLRDKGLGPEAAAKYEQAAKLFQLAGEIEQAAASVHMAGVSLKHDPTKAIPLFEQALKLYHQAGDEVGVGRVYRDMGIPYEYAHDYDQAMVWLEKSEEQLRHSRASAELGITIAKIGLVHLLREEFDQAEQRLTEALELIRKEAAWFYEMTTLMHLAELRLAQQDFGGIITYVWAGIGAILNAEPQLSLDGLADRYGRRFAQLYGLAAQGYFGLGNVDLAASFLEQSLDLIAPMEAAARQVVYEDIKAEDMLRQFSEHAPAQYEKLKRKFRG